MDQTELELDDVCIFRKAITGSAQCPHCSKIILTERVRRSRYRAGYSFKDARQAHILAIKMKRTHFEQLLSQVNVPHQASGPMDESESAKPVRVQWDPERSALLEKLDYRSIQIGISRRLSQKWATEWIEAIEDVTGMARALKQAIDENPSIGLEELSERGLVPREEVYEVDEKLRKILAMDL